MISHSQNQSVTLSTLISEAAYQGVLITARLFRFGSTMFRPAK